MVRVNYYGLMVFCSLFLFAGMSLPGFYDFIHPKPPPFGVTPDVTSDRIMFVIALALNAAAIGLIAFLFRRPKDWVRLGMTRMI